MDQEKSKMEFKSTVADRKLCSITIDVEVSPEIVEKEMGDAYKLFQQQARVDGFRQGKAPINLVKEKFAQDAKNRAIENVMRNTVYHSLAKENFVPIDFPVIDDFDYQIGQILKYSFTAECHPYIEVKNYKDIPVKKEIFKVTEKSLGQSLDALRDRNAKLVPSSTGIVTDKSFVSVDYDAFDDKGVAIAEITAKNHMMDLGSDNTMKGFAKALKGAKIGDEKEAKVEYPSDYPNKTLAGKKITFKTKVLEIKEKELPELNDDFAKDMGLESLEELKNKVKESIESEEKRRQESDSEKQVVEYLVEKNKFDVPQSLVAQQKDLLKERMRSYFKNQGVSADYIEKQIEKGEAKFKEEAEKNVRLSYILNKIYETENLAVTDADLEAEKNRMKESNPARSEAVDKYFAEKKDNIMLSLKETKLFKFLFDNAKIKEEVKDMPLKKEE